MLTPPPVGYLGGGPTCFPRHHFLFGSLSGGRRGLCLSDPPGGPAACAAAPVVCLLGQELASGARGLLSGAQGSVLKPEAEGPWHGGPPGGLWPPDPGSGIEASLGTVALLPFPQPSCRLGVIWEQAGSLRVILILPLCQARGPSSTGVTTVSPRRRLAARGDRTIQGGIRAVEEGTVGWWYGNRGQSPAVCGSFFLKQGLVMQPRLVSNQQ